MILRTSDITEMAENNGAMDVDPEGHRVYGPYGKRTVNLMWEIICICKIPVRCIALDSVRSKYVRYKYVKCWYGVMSVEVQESLSI